MLVMLKILQARFQQYMNREPPDVQAGLEKAEEPVIKLPISTGSSKKQDSSKKISISALLTIAKRNSHNLRYADDTTLMEESEEELKSLLIKAKEMKKLA